MSFILLSDDDAPALAISGAWATTTNTVRVTLTAEPLHVDAFGDGDALNVATWTITRLDTGANLTVIGIVAVDEFTFDISLLELLPAHTVTLEVSSSTIRSTGGLADPTSENFIGVVQTMDPVDAVTIGAFRDRDIANPPFQSGNGVAGTFRIGSSGDYENEAGIPLLRKLVIRRIGTRRGSFRHLPNYGISLVEKELLPSGGNLQTIRRDIETQTHEEPDVDSCRARLLLDRSGVLLVQLSIVAKGGVTLNIRMGNSGGQLIEV